MLYHIILYYFILYLVTLHETYRLEACNFLKAMIMESRRKHFETSEFVFHKIATILSRPATLLERSFHE